MLQVTFSPQGFMAAVEAGLLQYMAPGHFHWKAPLKQLFLYQATLAAVPLSGSGSCCLSA